MKIAHILPLALICLVVVGHAQSLDSAQIRQFLSKATADLMKDKKHEGLWLYPAYLGTNFISQYYVFAHYTGHISSSKLDAKHLRKLLIENQQADGSWKQVPEENKNTGELDTSIFNYWALKVMGEDLKSAHMVKAINYIKSKGGLEACTTMTKFFLALLQQYNWDDIQYVPLTAFKNHSIFTYTHVYNFVAQWIFPHLVPMAYLRYYKLSANMGERFSLKELWVNPVTITTYNYTKPEQPEDDILSMIEQMFSVQQPRGSFGAYTVSSLFTIFAMKDFSQAYPNIMGDKIQKAIQGAFEYIEWLYFGIPGGEYKGTLCEGRWWDNVLVGLGAIDAGVSKDKISPVVDIILEGAYQPYGGFAYGIDFEYAGDTDDTGLTVMLMARFGDKYKKQFEKSNEWLISMQNDDGGYGAFDKNKGQNKAIRWFVKSFLDSAELFDQSSVDLTGHILEGWGDSGYTLEEPFVQRAIQYIKNEQEPFGGWEGRWGVNYIYAAGAAIPGLARVGVDLRESWIKKSVDWLLSKQNQDGGWGESVQSYSNSSFIGVGVSTPSQTAWALLALVEVMGVEGYDVKGPISRGVDYLIKNYNSRGEWIDTSSVGSGHRGILYMQYPSYAKAWPYMALGRIADALENKRKPFQPTKSKKQRNSSDL